MQSAPLLMHAGAHRVIHDAMHIVHHIRDIKHDAQVAHHAARRRPRGVQVIPRREGLRARATLASVNHMPRGLAWINNKGRLAARACRPPEAAQRQALFLRLVDETNRCVLCCEPGQALMGPSGHTRLPYCALLTQ